MSAVPVAAPPAEGAAVRLFLAFASACFLPALLRGVTATLAPVFAGVFAVQWGVGLATDAFRAAGFDRLSAYRGAFALLAVCCVLAYLWFLWRAEPAPRAQPIPRGRTADNPPPCPD